MSMHEEMATDNQASASLQINPSFAAMQYPHMPELKECSVILTAHFYSIYQKILTFQKILIICLQVMHDYVHWYCSIYYNVK